MTLDYAVSPRLTVGIERSGSDSSTAPVPNFSDAPFDWLRFSDGDALIIPRFSWFISPEKAHHPSLLLGMASDRLSTPQGQAFFLTAGKSIPNTPASVFISIKTNTTEGKTVYPFGANFQLGNSFVLQAINDSDYTHILLTKLTPMASYSILWARTKHLGFQIGVAF